MTELRPVLRVVLAALIVSISIAIPAQASTTYFSETREELQIPIADEGGIDCTSFDGCLNESEGISFRDYHVGPDIQPATDEDLELKWVLWNSANIGYWIYHYEAVTYDLCMFDEDKELLDCAEAPGEWYSFGDMPHETEYLRVILREGAVGEYALEIWGISP